MPKYYCDYCDTYLTHDSPSVRKTHCQGRKHKDNVKFYYQKWMEEQAQHLIDATTAAFKAGKLTIPGSFGVKGPAAAPVGALPPGAMPRGPPPGPMMPPGMPPGMPMPMMGPHGPMPQMMNMQQMQSMQQQMQGMQGMRPGPPMMPMGMPMGPMGPMAAMRPPMMTAAPMPQPVKK